MYQGTQMQIWEQCCWQIEPLREVSHNRISAAELSHMQAPYAIF